MPALQVSVGDATNLIIGRATYFCNYKLWYDR